MKCPYDCGTELSEAATGARSHGCRNKLRAQRDALRAQLNEVQQTRDTAVELHNIQCKIVSAAEATLSSLGRENARLREALELLSDALRLDLARDHVHSSCGRDTAANAIVTAILARRGDSFGSTEALARATDLAEPPTDTSPSTV